MSAHYRRIAGNLELFCGAYFVAFGTLAAIFFRDHHRPRVAMICGAAALAGLLLITRASRLLAWRPWVYWTIAMILMIAPVVWLSVPH